MSAMPFRNYVVEFALEIALYGAILAGLVIVRTVPEQLAGQLFVDVEPQLVITPLPPDSQYPLSADYSHLLGPESGGCSLGSSLQDISMCLIAGSVVYALIFVRIFIPRDEKEQVQAILGTIINGGCDVFREYVARSLRMAVHSVKTLRARLEAIPTYGCLGVMTRLLFSMINQLKIVITCLFFFGLGVLVAMAYYHSRSFSTYVHIAGDLSLLASDLTDRAKALFATITKSNSILATVLLSLGLRSLVRFLVFFFSFISSHVKEARKCRLINSGDKQGSAILVEEKSLAGSDEDTLCDDETLNLKVGDTGESESKRIVQEAVSISIPTGNGDKEVGLKQRCKAAISNLSSTAEDSKYTSHFPSCATDRSTSWRQKQADKLNNYASSLSASSPEFVPRSRNTAVACNTVQEYCPPYWALASPVSVQIAAPMNRHPIERGTHLQPNAEMVGSNGSCSRL